MSTITTVKTELEKCINRLNIYTQKSSNNLTDAIDNLFNFTKLDYIESSGTQYIDADFIANQDTRIIIDFTDLNSSTKFITGARRSNGTNSFSLVAVSSNTLRSDYSDPSEQKILTSTKEINDRYVIDKIKNVTKLYKDNVLLNEVTATYTEFSTGFNVYIFTINNSGTPHRDMANIKLHSFKIYDGNTLERDFIPVLDSNNVACLFDRVNNKFYYNQGTGTFNYESN